MQLKDLKKGATEPGDCGNSVKTVPEWMDMKKFFRGREFIKNHMFPVSIVLHCNLIIGLSVTDLMLPLQHTKLSSTPQKALRRYLSTMAHINSWFTGNVWDPTSKAHASIKRVRSMHKHVAKSMKSDWPEKLFLSQYDMAIVQSGFMASIVLYTDVLGIKYTKAELDDFIFFWRGIGYLLGISDEYNMCAGGYTQTYNICKEIEQQVMLPHLLNPSDEYKKMADTYSEAVNILTGVPINSTISTVSFTFDILGMKIPRLGWFDWFLYIKYKVVLAMIKYCPGFEAYMNKIVVNDIDKYLSKYNIKI